MNRDEGFYQLPHVYDYLLSRTILVLHTKLGIGLMLSQIVRPNVGDFNLMGYLSYSTGKLRAVESRSCVCFYIVTNFYFQALLNITKSFATFLLTEK